MNRVLLVLTSACHMRLAWLVLLYGDLRTPPAVDLEACLPCNREDGVSCETAHLCSAYVPDSHC